MVKARNLVNVGDKNHKGSVNCSRNTTRYKNVLDNSDDILADDSPKILKKEIVMSSGLGDLEGLREDKISA